MESSGMTGQMPAQKGQWSGPLVLEPGPLPGSGVDPTVALPLAGTKRRVISRYAMYACSIEQDCARYIETPQLSDTIVGRAMSRPRREPRNRQEHALLVTSNHGKDHAVGELAGCEFQAPQKGLRLINVNAISFMP
jgi:hypothetical protein